MVTPRKLTLNMKGSRLSIIHDTTHIIYDTIASKVSITNVILYYENFLFIVMVLVCNVST